METTPLERGEDSYEDHATPSRVRPVTTVAVALLSVFGLLGAATCHLHASTSYTDDIGDSFAINLDTTECRFGAYDWAATHEGASFFDGFIFYHWGEKGWATWVNESEAYRLGLAGVDPATKRPFIRADYKVTLGAGEKRKAVRLQGRKTYDEGIFVIDVDHMPDACGTHYAWWISGTKNWPQHGEVDVVECWASDSKAAHAFHTTAGCTNTAQGQSMTGHLENDNCLAGRGCVIKSNDVGSCGPDFNARPGGGVFATMILRSHDGQPGEIASWFFPRDAVPKDINDLSPNPCGWGPPYARLPLGQSCPETKFSELAMDLTINFDCYRWEQSGCKDKTGMQCESFLQNQPSAFENVRWDVNSIKVYQRNNSTKADPKPDPEKAACFPADSAVQTLGSGPQPMWKVRAGDDVLVGFSGGAPVYEPVLGHLHTLPAQGDVGYEYVVVVHESGEFRASFNHLVFVKTPSGGTADKRVADVKVGDTLFAVRTWEQQEPSRVLSIRHGATLHGMYAPVTASGAIVVDGILASNYAGPAVGVRPPHAAMHALMFPVRFWHMLRLPSVVSEFVRMQVCAVLSGRSASQCQREPVLPTVGAEYVHPYISLMLGLVGGSTVSRNGV